MPTELKNIKVVFYNPRYITTLLPCVIITRTHLCVHTWSVRVQIHLICCVYAGSFMEFQCFEVKPEDDSKEITECSYDDKPSTGMFSVSWWGNFLHWCSLCTTLMLCVSIVFLHESMSMTHVSKSKAELRKLGRKL